VRPGPGLPDPAPHSPVRVTSSDDESALPRLASGAIELVTTDRATRALRSVPFNQRQGCARGTNKPPALDRERDPGPPVVGALPESVLSLIDTALSPLRGDRPLGERAAHAKAVCGNAAMGHAVGTRPYPADRHPLDVGPRDPQAARAAVPPRHIYPRPGTIPQMVRHVSYAAYNDMPDMATHCVRFGS